MLSLSHVPLTAALLGVPVSTNPPGCSPSDLRCRPMPVCHHGPSVATWATWATWTSHSLPQGAPQGISAVQTGEGRPGEESGASPFPPPTAQIRSSLRPPPHTAVPSVCAHCPGLCPACGTLLWALIRFLKPASPPLLDCKTVEGRGLLFLLFILNHSYYPSGQVITMCGTQNRENVSVSNETSVVERKTTFKIDVLNVTVQPPKPQLDPKPTVVQRRPLGSHWHAGRPLKLLRP